MLKLDVKGFSRKLNKFTPIGEGDIDYADVRKALREINFHGWLAAHHPLPKDEWVKLFKRTFRTDGITTQRKGNPQVQGHLATALPLLRG